MASNAFGLIFRITTWGESHGPAIGVVIDGCPAGLSLSETDIQTELDRRKPGISLYVSPRKEPDHAQILSGVFEGVTTGAPISILIANRDADPKAYEPIKHLVRPGHANLTYLQKYGIFDYRGGGRSSGRETAARVAAGAIAKKLLTEHGISILAYLHELGGIAIARCDLSSARSHPLFCPDPQAGEQMFTALQAASKEGDSLGGIVALHCEGIPPGLGDPIYEKLEANLAKAMLSIPATRGFEIGEGFQAARMKGSEHNANIEGTLGGIATGHPLRCRVAFKPTSSIRKPQATTDLEGNPETFVLPETSRHDPCLAIRAVPVVEAMGALVLADALLSWSSSKKFVR